MDVAGSKMPAATAKKLTAAKKSKASSGQKKTSKAVSAKLQRRIDALNERRAADKEIRKRGDITPAQAKRYYDAVNAVGDTVYKRGDADRANKAMDSSRGKMKRAGARRDTAYQLGSQKPPTVGGRKLEPAVDATEKDVQSRRIDALQRRGKAIQALKNTAYRSESGRRRLEKAYSKADEAVAKGIREDISLDPDRTERVDAQTRRAEETTQKDWRGGQTPGEQRRGAKRNLARYNRLSRGAKTYSTVNGAEMRGTGRVQRAQMTAPYGPERKKLDAAKNRSRGRN